MKNLKKVLPVILLILTVNVFGQISNIVTDDELYLASYYQEPLENSTYDATIGDGYTANYKYNFFAEHDRLNVKDDGNVLTISQESSAGPIDFEVAYSEVKKEIIVEKADGGSYVEDITAYTSSNDSVSKVLVVNTYWSENKDGGEITYTVIMTDNTVYTFLK